MVAICPTPIKGTMMRLIKVDTCGVPVTGASSLVVTTASFVSVAMAPQYEDGQEYFERTADGDVCVNQKDDPILKRMELNVQMCAIDPAMTAYVLSATALTVSTDTTGWKLPEGQPTDHFSLEVWQRVAGAGACTASGAVQYIYNAWPNVGAVKLGDYTIENGRSTLQFTAESGPTSVLWADGAGTLPAWLPAGSTIDGDEHWWWNVTTTAPPTGTCGPTLLP